MNFGFNTVAPCVNVVAPPDPRCADQTFAAANPGLCPAVKKLVIKPSISLVCALGSTKFSAFLSTNGVEQDVTADTTFTSTNPEVALVGALTGNATGVSQGQATIQGTYGDYKANAEMNVMGTSGDCCSQQQVAMMVLVDNSRSMSQSFASNYYATRLDFAKAAASRFISEVNATKDVVGLMSFNLISDPVLAVPTSDTATVEAAVDDITQSQQKTGFYNALSTAVAQVDSVTTADLRVLVLISDGEDTSSGAGGNYDEASDPIALLEDFRNSGGVVICLGCRASGIGFVLLSDFATGGFFINSFAGIESDSLDFLSGLKGYICAGNCTPAGDVMVATPELDYAGFANWDVVGGTVDLIGKGLFDLLPGNGLYVDLAGSVAPAYGRMVLKDPIAITAGNAYRLRLNLAGNQRIDASTFGVTVKVFFLSGSVEIPILSQTVVVNDFRQDFHPYVFSFTAPSDGDAYISIQQTSVPDPTGLPSLAPFWGTLLNEVEFDDVTNLVTLFVENFDTENMQYVPPRCGLGTTWYNGGYASATGYNCYGSGCLDEPVPVQGPDPNPLPDIESGTQPPTEYTSTRQACASCGAGFVNLATTPTAATTIASVPGPAGPGGLPAYATSVTLDAGASIALGAYAVPLLYADRPTAGWLVEGSNDLSTWATIQTIYAPPFPAHSATGSSAMFPVIGAPAYRYYRFTVTPRADSVGTGFTGLSLYAAVEASLCDTETRTGASQPAADTAAYNAALAVAQGKLHCVALYTSTVSHSASCPAGSYGGSDQQATATGYSLITADHALAEATAAATAAAEKLLQCTGYNNDQYLAIPDPAYPLLSGPSKPYPSVKYVTGFAGTIAHVSVILKGFKHASLDDVVIVLVSPGPTYRSVCLMSFGAGMNLVDMNTAIDLTFDDSGQAFTDGVAPVTGSYRPTNEVAGSGFRTIMAAPYPGADSPYTTLATLNGLNPNGAWSLWVMDVQGLFSGEIANGWDLIIT